MNTRQLSQGLIPTPEYERHHTYHTLRQFPELRRTVNEMQLINLRGGDSTNPMSHSKGGSRAHMLKSTHKLEELSKSCVDDISAMTDFRRVLLENRRKLKVARIGTSSVATLPAIVTDDQASQASQQVSVTPEEAAEVANKKLEKISVSFDSGSYNSHLAGFSGAMLNKKEFALQLRRCLNINLTRMELDALFAKMDVDHSQLIDGVEFIRYFFALGTQARWKIQLETMNRRSKQQEDEKARAEAEAERIKEWESAQISKFTEEDGQAVIRKLEQAAFKWDHTNYIESVYVNGFEAYLTPYDFKKQIDRSFGIRLTGAEIGWLIKQFSTRPGEHCIDGYMFLKHFCSLREKTWQEFNAQKIVYQKKKEKIMSMGQHIDILPKCLGR